MAFLDNSGDIILDAVLTEAGRRRMANGNFRITKFALGDDEINYGLYNKSHASGSAYYDLEILQTPVLQASTGINAGINYGLLSFANPNLLYMPSMRRNTKVTLAHAPQDKINYLAVNDGVTADALIAAFGGSDGGGDRKVLKAGSTQGFCMILETGLDTDEIAATGQNKTNYIQAYGLAETKFDISVDTRFFSAVLGPAPGSIFNNSAGSGESTVNFPLSPSTPGTADPDRKNYATAGVKAVNNNVLKRSSDTKPDTATSAIKGPRASVTALNFSLKDLPQAAFNQAGKTGATISGASGTYKYIDTIVKVVSSTGIVEQLPIRIIQKE
jgi:hypothetical protein